MKICRSALVCSIMLFSLFNVVYLYFEVHTVDFIDFQKVTNRPKSEIELQVLKSVCIA